MTKLPNKAWLLLKGGVPVAVTTLLTVSKAWQKRADGHEVLRLPLLVKRTELEE